MLRPIYPIDTARLRLRPFRPDDLEALLGIQSREDVTRFLYWGTRTHDDVQAVLSERLRQDALTGEGDKLILAVERRDTGAVIGDVNLVWLSRENRQGETGFVLHPDHHGNGFAHEAADVMLRLGFEELGLHRIIGRCDGRNTASTKVMEKLGMRREAHFRQNEIVKGEWSDEIVYALLADEWKVAQGMRP
ncbi:GNAT family protein [Thalassobaculum sp.]|uniref:GNAT family N-acetyltransferase n=1 Tax=Thalassobaculum sp. TaxID=2022740 RepID=UPI0032EF1C5C